MDGIEAMALDIAGNPWVYLLVFACCAIDGFFPPIPSETIVIALAATWAAAGVPDPALLIAAAAAGAFAGDQIAYAIGRRVDPHRWRIFRRPRGVAVLRWATAMLETRGASFIVAARFVPGGRVAVNVTAGAVRMPWVRFASSDALAALLWSGYGFVIGAFAGALLQGRPLLAVALGVAGGLVLGMSIDPIVRRVAGAPGP